MARHINNAVERKGGRRDALVSVMRWITLMEYTRTRAPCIYACVYTDSRCSARGTSHVVGASVLINNAWAFPFPSTKGRFSITLAVTV